MLLRAGGSGGGRGEWGLIDRQRIWSRRPEIGVLTANMICSCRLDPETEKRCSEDVLGTTESVNRLADNGIMSK